MSIKLLEFWCPGRPSPKGSWDPIVVCNRHNIHECEVCTLKVGVRTYMSESDASKRWQRDMALAAQAAWKQSPMQPLGGKRWDGPVMVLARFHYLKPGRMVPAGGPITSRYGDLDKLTRGLLDALTKAGVYADDRQVVELMADKQWSRADHDAGVMCEVYSR